MKAVRPLVVCLAAAMALVALTAAGASAAAPEFKVCVKAKKEDKKYTGKFKDKACSEAEPKGEGKYERAEWSKAKKKLFKAQNSGPIKNNLINPLEGGAIDATTECTGEKTAGEVSGATSEKWSTVYTGCKVTSKRGLNGTCSSEGAKEGEIKTQPLEGTLVFLNSEKTIPGLRVKPQSGAVLVKYSCVDKAVTDEATGEVLVERRGDVDKTSKESETVAKEGPKHGQYPYYEEEAHREEEAFTYFDYAACVEEEVKKGLTNELAELACDVKVGMQPPAPVSLVAHLSGAVELKAPAVQVGASKDKGEAFLIET